MSLGKHLGEVTNMMSHVTTTLSSHNPHETQPAPTTTLDNWLQGSTTTVEEWQRPPTNIHGCPAPPSMNGDDGPLATRTHHHDQQVHTNGHKGPPPPSTSTHERPQGTTPTINEWPQGETRAEGDPQGMWQNQSAFRSPPAHPSIHAQMNGDTHVVVTVHTIQVSNATPLPLSFFNTRRRGHVAVSGMANNNRRTTMTTHT